MKGLVTDILCFILISVGSLSLVANLKYTIFVTDNTNNTPLRILLNSPVKNFIYHAVPKSGSNAVRDQLRRYCKTYNLRCLGWNEACLTFTLYMQCANGTSDFYPETVNECCIVPEQIPHFNGLIDHFPSPLRTAQRKFLAQHFATNAFQFTVIRDPLQQIISFIKYICRTRAPRFPNDVYPRKEWIECNFTMDAIISRCINHPKKPFPHLSFNCSMTLTYIAGDNLKLAYSFLESLDVVAIYESLPKVWCVLREKLRWSDDYFNLSNIRLAAPKIIFDPFLERKFRKFYAKDYQLYHKAIRLFNQQLLSHPNCMKE